MIENVILIFHVLTAIAIIGLILLQQGKGADAGASFGAGSSQTVFGAAGGGNALTRGTALLAAVFFATSLALAVYAKQKADTLGEINLPTPAAVESAPLEDQPVGDIPAAELAPANDSGADIPAAKEGIPTK